MVATFRLRISKGENIQITIKQFSLFITLKTPDKGSSCSTTHRCDGTYTRPAIPLLEIEQNVMLWNQTFLIFTIRKKTVVSPTQSKER
jgi:hypothetical protein